MKNYVISFSFVLMAVSCKAQFNVILEADSTSFEVNASIVQLDTSENNVWEIGLPKKKFFENAFSPPFAIMTDSVNDYPSNNLSSFTVSLDSTLVRYIPNVFISFWHKYQTDFQKDGGYLEISLDSGKTWINVVLASSTGEISIVESVNFYTKFDTIHGGAPAFSGRENNWKYSEILLQWVLPLITSDTSEHTSIAIQTQKVMVRFVFKSDSIQTNKAGWIIDNLVVGIKDLLGKTTENKAQAFEVKVFPNPANEQSIIQVFSKNRGQNFVLNIYNTARQLLVSTGMDKNNQYVFKTNELIAGMYFYKIVDEKGNSQSGKLIVE